MMASGEFQGRFFLYTQVRGSHTFDGNATYFHLLEFRIYFDLYDCTPQSGPLAEVILDLDSICQDGLISIECLSAQIFRWLLTNEGNNISFQTCSMSLGASNGGWVWSYVLETFSLLDQIH